MSEPINAHEVVSNTIDQQFPKLFHYSITNNAGRALLTNAIVDALREHGHLPYPPKRESGYYWVNLPIPPFGATVVAYWSGVQWSVDGKYYGNEGVGVLSPRLEPPQGLEEPHGRQP